jgi:DNA-binding NarL/FixJ family response regulator
MTVVDRQKTSRAQAQPDRTAAPLVIAGNAATRQRLVGTMADQGLEPRAREEAGAIADLGLDDSSILVFCCDLDVSREISALRRLCREAPESAVVVVSPPATGAGVRRALDAGAGALVFEPEIEHALVATIRAVASGQSVVPSKVRASVERPSLSHREQQVLELVRQGLTNAEIANRLYLAESTVKSHLGSVFSKFGVHSRREATAVLAELEQESVYSLAPAQSRAATGEPPA